MSESKRQPGRWSDGELPVNVRLGANTLVRGPFTFKRFRGERPDALVIGADCTMESVQFAVGPQGRVSIGDFCYFNSVVILCELEIRIGGHVAIGWNTTIGDTDFHPLDPALRLADAVACSPLGKGMARPPIERKAVVIEDDVWIGPAATILKGVRIGAGSYIEAGSIVTRDVPAGSRVMGNPGKVVGG